MTLPEPVCQAILARRCAQAQAGTIARMDASARRAPPAVQLPRRIRPGTGWAPLQPPSSAQARYRRSLLAALQLAVQAFHKHVAPLVSSWPREDSAELRVDRGLTANAIRSAIRAAVQMVLSKLPGARAAAFAERIAKSTSSLHGQAILRQFAATLGVDILKAEPDLRPTVVAFTKENVALIRNLPLEYLGGVEEKLLEALQRGPRPETIAGWLQERYLMARGWAETIAVVQLGKLYGKLTEVWHVAVGIRRYRWRTVGDGRVRPAHNALKGEVFSYSKPPSEGHPGQAVRCRCWPEPILDS